MHGKYFDWLVAIVSLPLDYSFLLRKLYSTEFWWLIPFDAHRADDGIQLRYRFGRENGIPDPQICAELDNFPCSILEMIVALAIRCEEHIMGDENIGNRTSLWIHQMLSTIGLLGYSDNVFDEREVDVILNNFLNRRYERTGEGGLFCIPDLEPDRDMRQTEIWNQMNWYMKRY